MSSRLAGHTGIGHKVSDLFCTIAVVSLLTGILISCSESEEEMAPKEDPFSQAVEERRQAYLEYCLSGEGSGGIHNEIARLALGTGPLVEKVFYDALEQMDKRIDCSDFRVAGLFFKARGEQDGKAL